MSELNISQEIIEVSSGIVDNLFVSQENVEIANDFLDYYIGISQVAVEVAMAIELPIIKVQEM